MQIDERCAAVLFDKDGTLIDIHASWVSAGVQTLEELCRRAGDPSGARDVLLREGGYDIERGRLIADSVWAAGTTEGLVAQWIERLSLDPAMTSEMLDFMTECASGTLQPLTDVAALFEELRGGGLQIGVATMDLAVSAQRCLEHLGVADRVSFVCGCDSGFGHKPGPGMVQAFCAELGLSPERVLVVGDTPHDMHMGRAAGAAAVVGVLSGAASHAALAPLADIVLDDVSGLPETLAQLK